MDSTSSSNANILTLKIRLVNKDKTILIQFNSNIIVYDALKIIREKVAEANTTDAQNYGLFIPNSDISKGVWLENGRTLEYYMLKNEDVVEYRNKFRQLQIRLLDGEIHKLLIDDSQTVSQLMIDICSKIGIANYEEYSLINDLSESEKERTATLKKDKTLARDHKKMEELKKKLHTDDDIPWLDHSKTLRQQGIDENSKLILKRKFFFSDKNIDTKDPIQLKLLYIQCRDAIINGTHPIKEDEAINFAALQCQVEFGDYNESKHKSGFLDLKKFLPKEYIKVKGIEKKIFSEYKQLKGLNELDAQFKYTQLCRSLKTYGVTFFLVKEKMKGKNKLVARLLGVTKESIIRVDEKSKEFLDVYPLECVKKWAASPNTFTLDFGDHYKEPLYTMQTTEGENIARLIAGYIDIIMKKKKAKEFTDIDGDEESPMLEEIISPSKATIMQINTTNRGQVTSLNVGLPGVIRNGQEGSTFSQGNFLQQGTLTRQANIGYSNGTLNNNSSEFHQNRPQRPFLTTIDNARKVITIAQNNLQQKTATMGEIGNDPASQQWKENMLDVNKQNVTSHLSAMNAATAQVVTLTSDGPANVDYNAIGAAVSSISTNLGDFSKDILVIASLHDENDTQNERLLDAAKKLCSAFGDFLKMVEPDSNEPRQNLFTAVSKIGEASNDVMRNIAESEMTSIEIQESLISLAKIVASSTAGLVIAAKNVANHCNDQQSVNEVISLVTQCALSTSQLISCTKVCVSTISNIECQEQIIEAARVVSRSVDSVVDAAIMCCNDPIALDDLKNCAKNVYETVTQLLDNVRATNEDKLETKQDESIDKILNATDNLFNSMGDAPEMIKQAKVLAQATTELVNSLKQEAMSQSTSDQQRKLLHAAKLLAEATSKMVEAAKGCATNPQDGDMQILLRKAAEDLRSATTIAAGDNLQTKLIKKLELSAKQAASCATQSIAAVQVCTLYHDQVVNNQTHTQLIEQCKVVADIVPRIVQGIRGCLVAPESKSAHLGLVSACEDFVNPTQKMIGYCKAVLPTISDEIKSIQLRNCTKQLANALADLKTNLSRAQELCGSFEADAMIDTINNLDQELVQIRNSAISSILKPLPGESLEICEYQLGSISKTVGLSMAQMLTAAAQRNEIYTGIAAKDTVNSLRIFVNSIRGIVACSQNNYEYHEDLIQSSRNVLQKAIELIQECEQTLINADDVSINQQRLTQVARNISQSLYECVNCLPGQKEIDESIKHISESSRLLTLSSTGANQAMMMNIKNFPQTNKTYNQVQTELNHSAVGLNQVTNEIVVDARKGPKVLSQSTSNFSTAYDSFIDSGLLLAGKTDIEEDRTRIVYSLREVFTSSSKLLQGAKSVAADPQAPNVKNQLALAAKCVTDSINAVINLCLENNAVSSAQKQCDNALRDIETIRTLVSDTYTNEPVKDLNYYDCSDQIFEQSRVLAESLTGLKMSTEQTNLNAFVKFVKDVSQSICGLVEAAVQGSYLIGISDVGSRRGKAGILDPTQFIRSAKIIQDSCDNLVSLTATNQQQLIQSATLIAHTAASLCNASRAASTKTTNSLAKRHFVQSAKQVANATASLVKSIKKLDNCRFTQEHYSVLARPLIEAVDSLCQYALSPEFVSVPAIISENGMKAQEPIITATKTILDSSCELLVASKSLIANSKDPQQWQKFSTNSKAISEAIKKVATLIKQKAPAKFECDKSLQILDACTKLVENATIAAVNQSLIPPIKEKSLQVYQEQAINSAIQIMQFIDELQNAAKFEAEKLGHTVTEISNYFEPLVLNVIGCASKTVNSQQQMAFLEQTKTVLESASQLLIASKEGAGNSKNINCHQAIDENADGTREVLDDLIQTLEESTAKHGYVSNMVDNLAKAIARVDETDSYASQQQQQQQSNNNTTSQTSATTATTTSTMYQDDDSQASKYGVESTTLSNTSSPSFVEYQTRIVQLTKLLQKNAQDMSISQINELGLSASQLTQTFNALTIAIKGAIQTCSNRELECRIKVSIQELGKSCIDLVHLAGQYQNKPNDKLLKKELATQIDLVNRKASQLLSTFETNSKGTLACINASSAVNGIVADLDTVILFATSGTLTSEVETDMFNNHRESILKTAKTLVEDTKTLVTSATTSQEQLANAAQSAVKTITKLAEAVKLGAAALGSKEPDAQVLLINAVKDVASALNELIISTKLASSRVNHEAEMENLKNSAKNMVANVHSLLKTVKTVEDEQARGTRALESAIEAINQEIKNYSMGTNNYELDTNTAAVTAEDLIRVAKQITIATSKAVSAGTTSRQEDLIAAGNMGRKAVSDLLMICRVASVKSENNRDIHPNFILNAGYNCSICYKELLECIHMPVHDNKQRLVAASKNVANAVSDIVQVAEKLKDNDFVDPDDPTVIAENELLGAANAIEAAAKKLAHLKPRVTNEAVNENLNFDEQILEAAKSITNAASALIKAATAAQKELVAQGKAEPLNPVFNDDGQWSQGLISAARMVAAACHTLCEAANALVQGHATEERLISSAKQVASSTAALLVACKVKVGISSQAMRRLQNAGNAIKRATDALVRSAQQSVEVVEEDKLIEVDSKIVTQQIQEIMLREEILRKEKELRAAQDRYNQLKKSRYQRDEGSPSSSRGTPTPTVQSSLQSSSFIASYQQPNNNSQN